MATQSRPGARTNALEGTPRRPYTGYLTDLVRVERQMRLRRKRLLAALRPDDAMLCCCDGVRCAGACGAASCGAAPTVGPGSLPPPCPQ